MRNLILPTSRIPLTRLASCFIIMEVNLPSPACWIAGRKAGSQVLLDPYNVCLKLKVTDTKNKFFWCSRTKDLGCPVRVTLDRVTDCITRISGEHNHDSNLKP